MAKLKAFGDTLMIQSSITTDDYEATERHKPDALKLKDENKEDIFVVSVGAASVSKYGISFCSHNTKGCLFMTTENVVQGGHTDLEEEKKMIEDNYASIIANLIKVEKQVEEAKAEIAQTVESVSDSIELSDN